MESSVLRAGKEDVRNKVSAVVVIDKRRWGRAGWKGDQQTR
jgi:hypothetical protein